MSSPLSLIIYNDAEPPLPMTFSDPLVSIGKSEGNLLKIESVYLSRQHGVFERRAEGWFYRDLRSRNMTRHVRDLAITWVSPERGCDEVDLQDGDELRIGDTLSIRISLDEVGDGEIENLILAQSNPRDALMALGRPSGTEAGLKLLFETVRTVSQCEAEEDVLHVVAGAAFEALPNLSHVFLFRRGEGLDLSEGQAWSVAWSRGRLSREREDVPLYSQSLLEEAFLSGRAQLFSTQTGRPTTSESVFRARISSSVCAPLSGLEGSLGVLQADCRDPDVYLGESDLHLLTLLAEQAAVMIDRLRVTANIESMFEGFVQASVKAIESRDPSTAGHSTRVSQYGVHMARTLNGLVDGPYAATHFSEGDIRTLRYAALLHDFGKIGVSSDLLLKANKLPERTLQAIGDRFRIARMEVRARYAEARFERIKRRPDIPTGELAALKAQEEGELAHLDTEEGWLLGHMDSGRIPESDLPRLNALTHVWHTAELRLLEPDELQAMLSCRGTLTLEERRAVERHAWWTRCYLEQIPWSKDLARVPRIAGNHHEKLNGRGYPDGRAAEELCTEVRILTVCDIYDALTARDRTYRKALPPAKALDILQREVDDGAVDPEILKVFREVWAAAPVDT